MQDSSNVDRRLTAVFAILLVGLPTAAQIPVRIPPRPWDTCWRVEGKGDGCNPPDKPRPFRDYLSAGQWLNDLGDMFAGELLWGLDRANFRATWHELGFLGTVRVHSVQYTSGTEVIAGAILAERRLGIYIPLMRWSGGDMPVPVLKGSGTQAELSLERQYGPGFARWTWTPSPEGPILQEPADRMALAREETEQAQKEGREGPHGGVTGRIVDARSGGPVSGAQIAIETFDKSNTTRLHWEAGPSGPGGGFEGALIPAGRGTLIVQMPGYETWNVRPVFDVTAGAITDLGEIRLRPLASVSGLVLDPWGLPVQGAGVSVVYAPVTQMGAVTDDRGRFTVLDIPAGPYTLQGPDPDGVWYWLQSTGADGTVHWQKGEFAAGRWTRPEFELKPGDAASDLVYRFQWKVSDSEPPGFPTGDARLAVTPVDSVTHKPIPGAQVTIRLESSPLPRPYLRTVSDGGGGVFLRELFAGTYSVVAEHPGYARASALTDTSTGAAAPRVIELGPNAAIAGRIRGQRATTAYPLVVELLQGTKSGTGQVEWTVYSKTQPDALGRYRFFGLPAGEFTVRVSLPEQISGSLSGVPREDGPSALYLGVTAHAGRETAAPDLPAEGLRYRCVSGTLVSRGTGKPLTNLVLTLGRTSYYGGEPATGPPPRVVQGVSDSGAFAFDGLLERSYVLVVQSGYEIQRFDFDLRDHSLQGLTVLADDAIAMRIATQCGGCAIANLVGARFEFNRDLALDWDPPGQQSTMDYKYPPAIIQADGTASVSLLPGRYRVRIVGVAGYTLAAVQQGGRSVYDGGMLTVEHAGSLSIRVKKSP